VQPYDVNSIRVAPVRPLVSGRKKKDFVGGKIARQQAAIVAQSWTAGLSERARQAVCGEMHRGDGWVGTVKWSARSRMRRFPLPWTLEEMSLR
jgi:hypothetical protein